MRKFLPERFAILLLGFIGYGLTMARSLSFWDCGEYIAASNVLGIPHPPGNPLFVLLGRVFVLLFGWINGPAFAVNLISAISSVLCCLLIFEITMKILPKEHKIFGFFAASISLFGSTFWFNAVEAGPYAIAMLVIMLQIWASLKWRETLENKYLLLTLYISFLGLAIHTFCLLPLPAILIFVLIIKRKFPVKLFFAIPLLIIIGLSSQLYLPIRSSTEPILNENNPSNFENFIDVLGRKSYGDMSMFERALYRRGSIANQFGFSENIGYLGYHLNQWLPAPLGAQEPGSWAESFAEKMQFFHRIIFEFLIIAVFAGAWFFRKKSGVILASSMFLLSSAGLVLYLNLADGTRPDSYSAKQWKAEIKEFRKLVPDSIPNLPSLKELNLLFSFYYALPPEMRGMWIKNAPKAESLRTIYAWEDALEAQGKKMSDPPRLVHREVRNRDYFFTPAFLFFAIMAAIACSAGFQNIKSNIVQKLAFFVLAFAWLVPFASNFNTHNRSKDFIAHNFAMNILNSIPQNGILITYGDNDTFPLWYMQMAQNYRTDVVVINESLAYSDWYREQILKQYPAIGASLGVHSNSGKKFIREIIANNWPEKSVNFMIGVSSDEYEEFSKNMPLVGLVRNLGMEKEAADSLLAANLTQNYLYSECKARGQEANEQTIAIYQHLAKIAFGGENHSYLCAR
ncbi:MAG: DUF2723 domain-containing protein [Fibromonadaceae bacterium]|jgi:hypothetical protein|nr:DUF2723 domain-containing protein [Fibromonadaceae bacterium]